MKRTLPDYHKLAAKNFLAGTSFRIPVLAVEAGIKTIEEWCDCLREARERVSQHPELAQVKRQALRVQG